VESSHQYKVEGGEKSCLVKPAEACDDLFRFFEKKCRCQIKEHPNAASGKGEQTQRFQQEGTVTPFSRCVKLIFSIHPEFKNNVLGDIQCREAGKNVTFERPERPQESHRFGARQGWETQLRLKF